MVHRSDDHLRSTSRFQQIYAGIFVLGAGLVMGYLATREAIMYFRGSSAPPAGPLATIIATVAGLGGGYLGLRLILGWSRESALLPPAVLFCGGVLAFSGGIWVLTLDHGLDNSLRAGFLFAFVGLSALILGGHRLLNRW